MKLNRNICLMVLLGFILLYCCLGTSTLEGLVNAANPTKEPAEANNPHAIETQNNELNQAYSNNIDYINRERSKGNPYGFKEKWMNSKSWAGGPKSGLLDNIKDHDNTIREGDRMRETETLHENRAGLGCPSGYQKNRDNVCTLKPDNYNRRCDKGFVWNEAAHKCERPLGPGGKKQPDHGCPHGMHWDHKEKKCVHSKHHEKHHEKHHKKHHHHDTDSDSDSDSWNISKHWRGKKHHKHPGAHMGTYPTGSEVRGSQIPPGQEDMYVLKSKIVPPVCPACPPVLACPSKAKCAPCPRPPPIQPCPPCARCPEPNFDCKKVPNYKNPSLIPGDLPRPLLNDFSQFT